MILLLNWVNFMFDLPFEFGEFPFELGEYDFPFNMLISRGVLVNCRLDSVGLQAKTHSTHSRISVLQQILVP